MASNTTYYQYEDVKRNIAHRLFNMDGWKVYGYHADESDFMTDYYSPVYWNGIAEKNGYILVVDRSDERTEPEYTIKRTYNTTPAETAAKIAKLERMTQERGASEAEEATARAKIEALKAKENAETVEEKKLYAPAHKANPPRCNWHIEKDGVIYDKGTGLLKFYKVPDISKENEMKEWQKFNNTTPEEWKAEEAKREMWRWNESEERAAEIAQYRYESAVESYDLLEKFNLLLARFNNVCGGSVGNTENGYYTYEQVKVTKYKKELKPQETENGSIKDGQCFILKHNFTGGCFKGYVYRIHESEYTSAKTGETVKTYHAYRLGKGYKKERTGYATQSNTFSLYNTEKFMKWIDNGAIAWCELVEVSTPYEVTKTVKKHITPEMTEEPTQDAQTAGTTAGEEEPTTEAETATEIATEPQTDTDEETATNDGENTTEPTTTAAPDMFAELAKAYFTGKTATTSRRKAEKNDEPNKDTAEAETTATDDESEPKKPPKTAPGYTGETSDILTDEEAESLTNGEQVKRNDDETRYKRIFTAVRYTDRTALLYSIDRYQYSDEPREALQPGDDFHYIGFITNGKTYTNADAIREEMREDIAEAIRQAVPDEATARANAESCEEWERHKIESAEEYGANNAADLFYKDEPPMLYLYDKGAKITAADVIRYIENPAEVVNEYATEYAESHAAEIAAEYIKYNLLTAAINEIKADKAHPAHQNKKIAHCIGQDEKTARIELNNGETVTAEANAIRYITNGYISEWYIKAADRQKLNKDERGRAQDIKPEEIKAIYHGQRTLYKATPAA